MSLATPPSLEISFKTAFRTEYQRNNKTTGRKNIRCFPTCSSGGHVKNGFCGQHVSLSVVSNSRNVEELESHYQIVAETVLVEGNNSTMPEILDKNGKVTKDTLDRLMRSSQAPCEPLLQGKFCDDEGLQVLFNEGQMGWHYSWIGTKDTANAHHCFKVHVFRKLGESEFEYLRSVQSPSFLIFSRRRMARAKISKMLSSKESKTKEGIPRSANTVRKKERNSNESIPQGATSLTNLSWAQWLKEKSANLIPTGKKYEEDDVTSNIIQTDSFSSSNSGEDESRTSTVNASPDGNVTYGTLEEKVQALMVFIFNGNHQEWLPDGGANPNAKFRPIDLNNIALKRAPPSTDELFENEAVNMLGDFCSTEMGYLQQPGVSEAEFSAFTFPPQNKEVRDSIDKPRAKEQRVGGPPALDFANVDFGEMAALLSGPREESVSNMEDYSTWLLPDEMERSRFDHTRSALQKTERRNKGVILNFVHYLFDKPFIHDDITAFVREQCKAPVARKLLQAWTSSPESRKSLQSICSADLLQSEFNWTKDTPRGFLLETLRGIRSIVTSHVEKFFQESGVPLETLDLGLEPQLQDVAISSKPTVPLDPSIPKPPSYVESVGLVDIVVRRINAELTPTLSELLDAEDDYILEGESIAHSIPRGIRTVVEFNGRWKCVEDLSDFKESPLARFAGNTQMPHSNRMLQKVMPRLFSEVVVQYIPRQAFLVEGQRFLMSYPKRQFPLDGVPRPFQWSTPVVLKDYCVHLYQAWHSPNPINGYPEIVNKLIYLKDTHDTTGNPYKFRLLRQYKLQPPGVLMNVVKIFAFAGEPTSDLNEYLEDNHPNLLSSFAREYEKLV